MDPFREPLGSDGSAELPGPSQLSYENAHVHGKGGVGKTGVRLDRDRPQGPRSSNLLPNLRLAAMLGVVPRKLRLGWVGQHSDKADVLLAATKGLGKKALAMFLRSRWLWKMNPEIAFAMLLSIGWKFKGRRQRRRLRRYRLYRPKQPNLPPDPRRPSEAVLRVQNGETLF